MLVVKDKRVNVSLVNKDVLCVEKYSMLVPIWLRRT